MNPQVRVIVGLTVALAVSLCANMFMGGMILSERHLFEGGEHEEHEARGDNPGAIMARGDHGGRLRGALRDFAEAVPADVRTPLMEVMRAQRPVIEDKMHAVQQARRASISALKAETFDLAALQTALAAQRSAQSDVQAAVHDGLLKAIAGMTPEQRAELGDGAERLFK